MREDAAALLDGPFADIGPLVAVAVVGWALVTTTEATTDLRLRALKGHHDDRRRSKSHTRPPHHLGAPCSPRL